MREKMLLNGEWDFMPIYDDPFTLSLPKTLKFEEEKCVVPSSWREHVMKVDKYGFDPMSVFDYPEKWNKALAGVLHTTFAVPESMRGERLFLKFEGVAQRCAVYLNGVSIAEWNEEFLPLTAEITERVHTGGVNDLSVVCATFPEVEIAGGEKKSVGLLGSVFGVVARGIWQDVYLYSAPKIYIDDYEIVTSVREGSISIYAGVNGEDSCGVLTALVTDGRKTVKTLSAEVNGVAKTVTLSDKWTDAEYWDTENPHLYSLTLALTVGGKKIDEVHTRFGFREFWAEGSDFYLNGTKINLRGDSWHFHGPRQQTKEYALNWCRMCKEHGANSIRYHAEPHPSYYLDAADECGVLIVDETAIYGSGKTMDCSHKDYLNNCRHHIKEFVKRDKNHACVVIWSLQNELRWAYGRDEYKKYVPEFIELFHKNDRSGRLVSLDGDNRLIDFEHTEIESRHYNIDGTLAQWTRKTPLTVGEHGEAWALAPQDASMYFGLGVYHDSEYCAESSAYKEKLFLEYARKKDVSGISSFNFAYYFAKSMPDCDVVPTKTPQEGIKPKVLKKYSFTINNGLLPKKYPAHVENVACRYITEAMRPVTVLIDEYDEAFYDDFTVNRTLYVFNDTLSKHRVTLHIEATCGGKVVFDETEEFEQSPAQKVIKTVKFKPQKVDRETPLEFKCTLYHDGEEKFTLTKPYRIFPSENKREKVCNEKVSFYGSDGDYEIVKKVVPNLCREDMGGKIQSGTLIIGSNVEDRFGALHDILSSYVKSGGKVVILEQNSFTLGAPILAKKRFFRAHTADYSHPMLKGLSDRDLIFWDGGADEVGPMPICSAAFEKSGAEKYHAVLECSFGSWNMDGDYWTPLIEYKDGGLVVACQLPLIKYFDTVPAAATLLKNIISYAVGFSDKNLRTVAINNPADEEFLGKLGVKCSRSEKDIESGEVIVVSSDRLSGLTERLRKAASGGATVFVMPSSEKTHELSELFDEEVDIVDRYAYILKADYTEKMLESVSLVDLFGFDKLYFTQRVTENRKMAEKAIYCKGARTVLESVEGTTWEDNFVNGYRDEMYLRPLVEYNRENKKDPAPYMIIKKCGRGKIVACQLSAMVQYEKSLRAYSRIFENLGVPLIKNGVLTRRGDEAYAVEAMTVLPYPEYLDFDEMFAYFSDKEFSLNNLGEGVYGWMNRTDRDGNGYLNVANSSGNGMFMTSFVSSPVAKKYLIESAATREYVLYVNGKKIKDGEVDFVEGYNRLFIYSPPNKKDLSVKVIIKNTDGSYATDLIYRTTIDEVDPK